MTSANVEAAKAIRAEVRALAKTDERLAGTKVSVTAGSASLMSEVKVRISGYADGTQPARHDKAAIALARDLWAIVNKHWTANSRMRFSDVYINDISFWGI